MALWVGRLIRCRGMIQPGKASAARTWSALETVLCFGTLVNSRLELRRGLDLFFHPSSPMTYRAKEPLLASPPAPVPLGQSA